MIGLLCVTAALQPEMDDCMVMGRMAAAAIGYGWLCLDLAAWTCGTHGCSRHWVWLAVSRPRVTNWAVHGERSFYSHVLRAVT
jgi:hypothetical protein